MVSTSATKARAEFADLLNKVIYNQQPVIIKRHGKPCAALVPINTLESIEKLYQYVGVDAVLKALEDERNGIEPLSFEEVMRHLGLEGFKEEPEEK
jgi:prevent-host-death family protein